jgi:hypothetical protein
VIAVTVELNSSDRGVSWEGNGSVLKEAEKTILRAGGGATKIYVLSSDF